MSDYGYLSYNGNFYANYSEKVTIKKINSISGVPFQLEKNGTSLVKGREWYTQVDGKTYFFSISKSYKMQDVLKVMGINDEFYSFDLYANWNNKKKTSGIDISSGKKSSSSSTSTTKKATSFTISASKSSIAVGESIPLSTTFKPSGSKKESITWSSSNTKIATVSSSGKVVGVSAGTVKITGKSKNGLTSSIRIIVIKKTEKASTHKVTIKYHANGGKLASKYDSRISLKNDYVYYNNSYCVSNILYNQALSSNGLADYNNPGWINLEKSGYSISNGQEWNTKKDGTGKSYKQATSYKANDFCDASKKDCTVVLYANWKAIKAKSITISPTVTKIAEKDKVHLKVNYTPTNALNEKLTWSSSNTAVATVNSSGELVGKKAGTTTISVKSSSGLTSSFQLTVQKSTHKVIIKYHANGGSLSKQHGNSVRIHNGFIQVKKNVFYTDEVQTLSYGTTLNSYGLSDYNNSSYINLEKNGASIVYEAEWNTKADGTGRSFSQYGSYKASDFCDASKKDCTITLYANWNVLYGKIHVIDFYPSNYAHGKLVNGMIQENQKGLSGDSVLIESNGKYILMDTGIETSLNTLEKRLASLGVKRMSLYVSHYHGDHCGKIASLIGKYQKNIEKIYLPKIESSTDTANCPYCSQMYRSYNTIVQKAKECGISDRIVIITTGSQFSVGKAKFQVLYQRIGKDVPTSLNEGSGKYTNNSSLVTMVTIGKTRYLTSGDIEVETEQQLINKGINIKADIFKLNHHSGRTSNQANFIQKVNPTYVFYESDWDFNNQLTDWYWINDAFDLVAGDYQNGIATRSRFRGANILSQRYNGNITYTIYNHNEIRINATRNQTRLRVEYKTSNNQTLKIEHYQFLKGVKQSIRSYDGKVYNSSGGRYQVPYYLDVSNCGGVSGYKAKDSRIVKVDSSKDNNIKSLVVTCVKK